MMFNSEQWLEIGKIVAPQGLRGEMRVYPSTDFPERFLEPGTRWLQKHGSEDVESVQLTHGRFLEGKGLYIIQIENIKHRDQAEALRNSLIFVPASDRPPLKDGEFHVADLVGLPVFHHITGDCIGNVKDVFPAGNDLLEVELIQHDALQIEQQKSLTQEKEIVQNVAPNPALMKDTSSNQKKGRNRAGKPKKINQSRTILIPFVYDLVPIVDLDAKRIEVLPPSGLFDL